MRYFYDTRCLRLRGRQHYEYYFTFQQHETTWFVYKSLVYFYSQVNISFYYITLSLVLWKVFFLMLYLPVFFSSTLISSFYCIYVDILKRPRFRLMLCLHYSNFELLRPDTYNIYTNVIRRKSLLLYMLKK